MKKITLLFILIISVNITFSQDKPSLIIPVGHTDEVSAVAITPDGKYVISAGSDKIILV